MPLSKRAKARCKIMSASEKGAIKKAAKTLFDAELLGVKRMNDILRWLKRC